ncbi:hypothetical protein [Vibrio viridaestus]|uniref:Uncharacterized protein n=1 Tax=Vibrio viridaestus TaxID=2487322 RepID=A0A3N9TL49_9VIBR|nr:hypothetical protein [Vibrio viridaestus]RQW64593.1 hypothetical protein EES38_00670 [Vibrio viridaestus]
MGNRHSITSDNTEVNDISNQAKSVIIKNLSYAGVMLFICLATIACIHLDVDLFGPVINETSITECVQQILLGISSIAFYRVSIENPRVKQAALLISGFFMVMFIRELDFLFDYLHHGSWVYPALFVAAAAIYNACKEGADAIKQMAIILNYPDMKILIVGVMFLLVFSRLYGMGSFWQELMGQDYQRAVKNVAEESVELLCYFLITVSAVLTQFGLKKALQSKQM